ncbi:MAG: SDR family oxidoreductase [Magnetospirillum sp.]|nr:SDR family oxidoreductase [Magnetospirillum sp.]
MRVFLITGAGSGIGAAAARRLAGPATGFLLATRRNAAGLEALANELRASGASIDTVLGETGDPAFAETAVARACERFGRLDVVVACAGAADRAALAELTRARLDAAWAGMTAAFGDLARAAAPALAASRTGRLIGVSSFVATLFRADLPAFAASAAAKAGLEALVRALALELASSGATVNAVAPGFTRKDGARQGAMDPERWRAITASIPMGRLAEPAEIAETIAWLAGPEAGFVTGQILRVDGGLAL